MSDANTVDYMATQGIQAISNHGIDLLMPVYSNIKFLIFSLYAYAIFSSGVLQTRISFKLNMDM